MKKTILLIDAGYLHPILREEGIFYDANMIAQIAKDCCVLTNFAPFLCFSK
jgi:hypothetical protein